MGRIILFNKPFNVLSQFTDEGQARDTLAKFIPLRGVYPAGRLDRDSEGLLILTDNGQWQARIAHPKFKAQKTYLVQVEGQPDEATLETLRRGVMLKDGMSKPARVSEIPPPHGLWPRVPPVRFRKSVPDRWLRLSIHEGRNRQIRRMTAAVGHPTLRLIRESIAQWSLEGLAPGCWRDGHVPDSFKQIKSFKPPKRQRK